MKSNILKLGTTALLGFTVALTAQAQYHSNNDDLLMGFTVNNYSLPDLVIDLGTPASIGVGGTTTVDLIAHGNVGMTAAQLQAELAGIYGNLNRLGWGVVGGHINNFADQALYSTKTNGAAAPSLGDFGNTGFIDTVGQQIPSGTNQVTINPALGYLDSWTEEISPGSGPQSFTGQYYDPDIMTSSSFSTGVNYVWADFYVTKVGYSAPQKAGYFKFGSDGSLTFTPAVSAPPPQPQLSVRRTGTTTTISFGTTSGAVYSLYSTNTAGLRSPVANWTLSGTTITGNGGTTNFTDVTTDASRVYRVKAQ